MNVRAAQNVTAAALAVVLLVLLGRVVLLSEPFGGLSLVATAAAVAGLGVLLSAGRGGSIRAAGSAVTLFGLASLVVSLGLTIYLMLACCA